MPRHIVHPDGPRIPAHIPEAALDPVRCVVARPPEAIPVPRILTRAPLRRVPTERTFAPKVYVALDSDGRALYVGSTDRLSARIGEHESDWAAPWAALGRGSMPAHWLWFPGTGGAALAEEGLIRLLRPQMLNRRRDGPTRAHLVAMWNSGLRW